MAIPTIPRYKTIVEGIAGGAVPANTGGLRPPDALNLWPSIMDGSDGPRTEVVHQVENGYSCDTTQPGGGCCRWVGCVCGLCVCVCVGVLGGVGRGGGCKLPLS
jgi:hypothetical protein